MLTQENSWILLQNSASQGFEYRTSPAGISYSEGRGRLMNQKPFLVALGALTAALAGCGSEINPPTGAGASAGTGATPGVGGTGATGVGGSAGSGVGTGATAGIGTGGTGTGATGSGGTAGGTAGEGGTGAVTCVPGVPASSQIPRMLNRQYDA